jgi:ubiquinone/menaquinone biosynthesis C-methylase UbiE
MAPKPADQLREWVAGYQTSIPILTARRLGIFSRLAKGPKTPDQLRRAIGANGVALRRLLDALLALGLLQWKGERVALAPPFAEALDPDNPDSLAAAFDHQWNCLEAWMKLETAVLDGPGRVVSQDQTALDPARNRAFHHAMRAFGRDSALDLMKCFDFRRVKSVLDVGGGTGVIGAEICARHRHLRWAILDRAAALVMARRRLRADRLTGRVTCVQGDALIDAWPEGHDAVLLSQLIHAYGMADVHRLVELAARALPEGGFLLIRDFISRDARVPSRQAGLFGINMLVNTLRGRVYSLPELRAMIAPAFRFDRLVDKSGRAQLLVARRR